MLYTVIFSYISPNNNKVKLGMICGSLTSDFKCKQSKVGNLHLY